MSAAPSRADDQRAVVLLICPPFFSYHESIIEELRSRGLRVIWWSDRPSQSVGYKIMLRLAPRLLFGYSARLFAAQARELAGATVGDVLVVKGEGLSPATVDAMRAALPGARFAYYLWDAVDNVRAAPHIAPLFDSVATFDPQDARRYGWIHRPLFARNAGVSGAPAKPAAYDWMFAGTLHSDRLRVLRRLMDRTAPGRRVFAFGFIPGKVMWVLRHLTDAAMWRRGGVTVSTQSMPSREIQAIVETSRAVVDVEHPKQRGLTMRTIETLLADRKLITTNQHVRDSDLYDPSRICVVDRRAPSVPDAFLESSFAPVAEPLRRRYTLAGFIDELLPSTRR